MFRNICIATIALAVSACAVQDVGDLGPDDPLFDVTSDSATLRVTAPDGTDQLRLEDDRVIAEVRVGQVNELRTLGLRVSVEGAAIVEWERDDAFLTSAGGQIIQLTGRSSDQQLDFVVATTATVSTDRDAIVARLVLRPTGGELRVSLDATGQQYGLITGVRDRVAVQTFDATLAR